MYRICICDEQVYIQREWLKNLDRYMMESSISHDMWEIEQYDNAELLLEEEKKYDVYFLNLEMGGYDVLEIGKRLIKKWDTCNIIAITGNMDSIKSGYIINAFRCMTRPLKYVELKEGIDALRRSTLGCKYISLKKEGREYNVLERNIRYICCEDGDTIVYVNNTRFRSERSLDGWENILEKKLFFRCHKGYLVNVRYVADENSQIILKNGEKIPVSRRKRKGFRQAVVEYDIHNGDTVWGDVVTV